MLSKLYMEAEVVMTPFYLDLLAHSLYRYQA